MVLTEQERAEVMRRVLKDDHVQAIRAVARGRTYVAALAIEQKAAQRRN